MKSTKKPLEIFRYLSQEPEDISDQEVEALSFDTFKSTNSAKNKRKFPIVNNKDSSYVNEKFQTNSARSNSHRATKKQKKAKDIETSSLSEDDGLVVINSGNNSNEMSEVDMLLKRLDSDSPKQRAASKNTNFSDPSAVDSLNRLRKLRANIAQTQQTLAHSISIDLLNQNSEEEDDSVVKIILTCEEQKKQYTFSVKKAQKFQLLADKLSSLINVPSNQIQFKLYMQIIDFQKCPDDYDIINNEKLTVTTIRELPDTNDEFKKELEKKLKALPSKVDKVSDKNTPRKITLHVVMPGQNKHLKFKILPTEKFEKIIDLIFAETGKRIKLMFDGEILDPKSTPNELDMEGGEQIDAKV